MLYFFLCCGFHYTSENGEFFPLQLNRSMLIVNHIFSDARGKTKSFLEKGVENLKQKKLEEISMEIEFSFTINVE